MVVLAGFVRFPDNAPNCEEPMDELLLRYLCDRTTDEENRSVEALRSRSAEAEGVLGELRQLIRAGEAADLAVDPGSPPPVEQLIWRAEARRAQLAGPGRSARPWLRHPGTWTTAVAAAIVGFILWNVSNDGAGPGESAVAVRDFLTATDETAMVRLDDGSVVRLGPESRLTTHAARPADVPTRQVTLEGEAYFSIAADKARPFVVSTAAGSARVLGTRFHLAVRADQLAVVVVEGRVALAGPNQEVEAGAGQATRLVRGSAGPVVDAPPIEEVADWLRDFLIFRDTPLAVAMGEIGERYGMEVELDNPALMERTLTMWFHEKSLEEVMTVVCSVTDAHCTIDEAVIRIEARAGGPES